MITPKPNPIIVIYSKTLKLLSPSAPTLSDPFTKITGNEMVKTQTA